MGPIGGGSSDPCNPINQGSYILCPSYAMVTRDVLIELGLIRGERPESQFLSSAMAKTALHTGSIFPITFPKQNVTELT